MSAYFVDKSQCAHKSIFPGVDIFTRAGKQMMLSLVEFQPGAVVEALLRTQGFSENPWVHYVFLRRR